MEMTTFVNCSVWEITKCEMTKFVNCSVYETQICEFFCKGDKSKGRIHNLNFVCYYNTS